jgi:hypothetical protein
LHTSFKYIWFLLFTLAAFSADAQMTVLRKNVRKQNERTEAYSKRSGFGTNNYQIGCLLRHRTDDSLSTAKGLSSWQYGVGMGYVMPLAGPTWFNVEFLYQYRNYKLLNNEKSLLAPTENVRKLKLALHTISAGGYLRFSTARSSAIQGKYIELGYVFGWNFGNRLIYFEQTDPMQTFGASQSKTKIKNTGFFERSSQVISVRIGKEAVALFAEYRLTDFFKVSRYTLNNQKLPELSNVTIGISIMLANEPYSQNTDENDSTED